MKEIVQDFETWIPKYLKCSSTGKIQNIEMEPEKCCVFSYLCLSALGTIPLNKAVSKFGNCSWLDRHVNMYWSSLGARRSYLIVSKTM